MQFTKTSEVSLSDATKPLLVVSRLVGINPKSYWHKIYTGLLLACMFSLLCHIWQFYISGNLKNFYFEVLVYALHDVFYIISISVIWGLSLFNSKRFMVPLSDFATVDESLKSLGGRIDNRGTYRVEISQIIFVGLIPLSFWITEFNFYISFVTDEQSSEQLYAILMLGLLYHLAILIVCAIVDCSFSVTLSVIRKRFEELNSIIRRLGTQEFHLRINVLEVSRAHTDDNILRALTILRNQYHDLWEIANKVNDAYGLHLLVGMITSLAVIASKLYEGYSEFAKLEISIFYPIARSANWVSFYVMRISALAQACESTVAEAKATYVALHNLSMKQDHSPATKGEIRDFFTQLQFEVRNFTAYNFFDIDYTLVCGILGAAFTYLVILIQMGGSSACVITVNCNESLRCGSGNNF